MTNPKNLIGHRAIRTKHVTYGNGSIDRSFMDNPVLIKAVQENDNDTVSIVVEYKYSFDNTTKEMVLPSEYGDNNWTSHDDLMWKAKHPEGKKLLKIKLFKWTLMITLNK